MSKKFTYHIPVTVPSTKEVTPEDIYENCSINITPGWEVIDFRPPVVGDKFWGNLDTPRVLTYNSTDVWSSPQTPRLILKKSQRTVSPEVNTCIKVSDVYGPETITLPEGWKFERFGMPKHEDMVLSRYYKDLSRDEPVYKHFNTDVYPKDILPRIIVKKDQ